MNVFNIGPKTNSDVKDKIKKLSADYWNYKGFYKFPDKYNGFSVTIATKQQALSIDAYIHTGVTKPKINPKTH